jgi:hypothetical protein
MVLQDWSGAWWMYVEQRVEMVKTDPTFTNCMTVLKYRVVLVAATASIVGSILVLLNLAISLSIWRQLGA